MTTIQGLTEATVLARRECGDGNDIELATSRTYGDIIRQNVFNLINVVLFTIGAVMIAIGRVGDATTSVGLIILNVVIGLAQEVRAKRKLDQIALLTRPKVTVRRDGQDRVADPAELVRGDIVVAQPGDQIVVDGTIVAGGPIEVDESNLTGESDLVRKNEGDELLSGSYCVTGSALYEAQRVGAESFVNKTTARARAFRVVQTPLQRDVDFAIRSLLLVAIFFGFLLFMSGVINAIPLMRSVQMAAVIAGLVPNGLFLMVIIAYSLGALRIAGQGALVQQTNAIESLSNVNILCVDKTGTLTANRIIYHDACPIGIEKEAFERLLADFASSASATNRTSAAIIEALGGQAQQAADEVPFSSARKWSALVFDNSAGDGDLHGVYVLGALEMLQPYLQAGQDDYLAQLETWCDAGLRVLIFAHNPEVTQLHGANEEPQLPKLTPLGALSFSDELRPNIQETIAGFAKAGIQLKIISGDNPHTVAALAKQAGMPGDLRAISGPELAEIDSAQIGQVAEDTTIFGRITPEQKEMLVDLLQERGHYVAMIGDGVNDVLSLKKANLGIAMHSGSAATRGVADIVLLNDSFAVLPPAFQEGQRIVSGMQDILRLFLTRVTYAALLILATAVVGIGFPFVPKHNALITTFTVGIPTLLLAIWARPEIPKGGLLRSIVHFVVPAAMSVFVFGLLIYTFFYATKFSGLRETNMTPEEIAHFESFTGIDYEITSLEAYAAEVAGLAAQTALTTFSVLAGLLMFVFVEPSTPFFVGGDVLSPDRRPTILAGGLLVGFVALLLIEPLRDFFEMLVFDPVYYIIIVVVTLVWALVLRRAWRKSWFERFMRLDAPG